MSTQEIIDRILTDSTRELFSAYGIEISEAPAGATASVSEELSFAAVLGFTGEAMRGTLLVAPTSSAVARSYPGGNPRDWVGELGNQLLGRVKNKLLGFGVELHVSTPLVIRGHYLAPLPRGELEPRRFDASPGEIAVWFDAEIADGTELIAQDSFELHREGDAILF